MIEALERAAGRPVSRETFSLLEAYIERLKTANTTKIWFRRDVDDIWGRHILDSAQLVASSRRPVRHGSIIGSGAGLPGISIAALVEGPVTLVEPRRLRVTFLEETVAQSGLADRVTVLASKIENIRGQFDVITARAVAPLGRLLGMGLHLAHSGTIWALPKGKSADSELAEAQRNWQCDARSETSCTDPNAAILVLSKVKAKLNR